MRFPVCSLNQFILYSQSPRDFFTLPAGYPSRIRVEIRADQRDFLWGKQIWLEVLLLAYLFQGGVIAVQLEFEEIDAVIGFQDGVDTPIAGLGFRMDIVTHQLNDDEEDILEIRLVLVMHVIRNSKWTPQD